MDQSILLAINQGWAHPWLDALFGGLSQKSVFSFPLLLLILLLLAARWRVPGLKLGLLLIATVLLGDLAGNALKHLVPQYRPCAATPELVRLVNAPFDVGCSPRPHGLVSNHALDFSAATAFLAVVLRSWTWAFMLGGVALLVGLARIYLGVHYPSQVLVGALVGVAIGGGAAWVTRRYCAFTRALANARPAASTAKES